MSTRNLTNSFSTFTVGLIVFGGLTAVLMNGVASGATIGHYTFDSDFTNSEGNAPTATGNGGASIDATAMFGSGSLFLNNPHVDNDDQRLDIANVGDFQGLTNLTLAMWVNPNSWNSNARFLQKGGDGDWRLMGQGSNLRFDMNGQNVTEGTAIATLFPVDEWHHVAAVFDGDNDTMKLYVDAVEVESSAIPGGLTVDDTTAVLGLGQKGGGTHPNDGFDGRMDEFWIIGDALTQTQIENLVNFNAINAPTAPAVPEPASIAIWSILGLCLAGYGYRRRRRNS